MGEKGDLSVIIYCDYFGDCSSVSTVNFGVGVNFCALMLEYEAASSSCSVMEQASGRRHFETG